MYLMHLFVEIYEEMVTFHFCELVFNPAVSVTYLLQFVVLYSLAFPELCYSHFQQK